MQPTDQSTVSDKKIAQLKFPKRFLWGVSTSAHQYEGNTRNQWTQWEAKHANVWAAQSEYSYSDVPAWTQIKAEARRAKTYRSDDALNHYELYEADIALAKKIGLNAWRFSVEWSRIEPEEGKWDEAAITHYRDYVAALKKAGLEPVLTLFHFTLPVWLSEKGGFLERKNIDYFVRFAEKIVSELGVSIKYIITLNEPQVYAQAGYLEGNWPPGHTSRRDFLTVLANLARAHNRAAAAIHAKNRRYKVSIAHNFSYVYPGDDAWLSRRSAQVLQYTHDDYFFKKVVKTCDFIGVNYYGSDRVYGYRVHNQNAEVSDLGWELAPDNLQFVLERLDQKYHLPIIITENGLADGDDEYRIWWLARTVRAMQNALDNGVKLEGYFHWSLLDNFEWDKGFWPKFGLFSVDRSSQKRTPRPSALWLRNFLKKVGSRG